MERDWILALIGGALIGISVSLMLLWNGRVTGISGIVNGLIHPAKGDLAWRWSFVLGLVGGGAITYLINPSSFSGQLDTELWTVSAAGLLVGFGTILGSGCTSGHGICGISRLSPRSLVATLTFIAAGVMTVALLRKLGVFA